MPGWVVAEPRGRPPDHFRGSRGAGSARGGRSPTGSRRPRSRDGTNSHHRIHSPGPLVSRIAVASQPSRHRAPATIQPAIHTTIATSRIRMRRPCSTVSGSVRSVTTWTRSRRRRRMPPDATRALAARALPEAAAELLDLARGVEHPRVARPERVRRRGRVHLDQGIGVPVRPLDGLARGLGRPGQELVAGGRVAVDDRAVRGVDAGLHGVPPASRVLPSTVIDNDYCLQEGVPVDGFTVVRCGACAHAPSGFDEDAHGTVAALPVSTSAAARADGAGAGVRRRPHASRIAGGRGRPGPQHRRRPCGDPLAAGRRRPRPAGTARAAALRDLPGGRPRLRHAEHLLGPPAVTSARGDKSVARVRPGRAGSGSEHPAPGPDAVARPHRARDRRRPARRDRARDRLPARRLRRERRRAPLRPARRVPGLGRRRRRRRSRGGPGTRDGAGRRGARRPRRPGRAAASRRRRPRARRTGGPARRQPGPVGFRRSTGELSEELDRHWAVDARASILLTQAWANAHDDTRSGGAAVLLTSGQARGPMPGEVAYAAAKAAVAGITPTLADQLADRRLRVNTVNPGPVDTGYLGADAFRAMAPMFPFGRFGEPDDPARLIAWLCTDEAAWITGQVIDSEGGFARHRNGWRPW
ncbi:hypothetical protein L7F22_000105 [Adiantum nelumboides]|nr:hypothetical protein [Adiantum nelumboides]